ncbi:MAG: hypothetical protein C5B44_06840 [Acidobacteria bacterium]|nr:MAG: hypothetical protein C5B44_06840 [Acidobacteriota bacterium]
MKLRFHGEALAIWLSLAIAAVTIKLCRKLQYAVDRIIKRLDAVHEKLLADVLPIDADRFRRRPSENEWSVAEIIYHLNLVEERVIKDLERGLAGEPCKPGLLTRLIPTSIVGIRLLRVKAPKGVLPTNPPEKEIAINKFQSTRRRLKDLCAQHGAERLRNVVFNHPFLGKLSGSAAVSFVGYHELRHYKQIKEVLREI